jgi:tetratricopeptide (TPR) repeat protein
VTRYSRQDVLRILRLQAQQLAAWEREGLFPTIKDGEPYSFEHLSRLRALREMRSKRLSARSIRAQVDAMQRVAGMRNALVESSAVRSGSRLAFRHGGALVDPMTRQLAFDFALSDAGNPACRQLRMVGGVARGAQPGAGNSLLAAQLQEMFTRAVQLEESASTIDQAVDAYYAMLELKPDHAPACINLGTIFYNQREFSEAERMYRRATEADPGYALAFFDLGNVLDEMQRLDDAIGAYQVAIKLVPQYADAHYNLALAYERQGERRRALRHWMAYVRLDPVGPWAAHAKGQARKILALERLSIVSRSGMRVSAAG